VSGGYYTGTYRRFSRPWWVHLLHDLLWVTVVSILIWIFADMKFTEDRRVTASLRLQAAPASDLVMLDADGAMIPYKELTVQFDAHGSRETLDLLENNLTERIMVDIAKDRGPGESKIPTADILQALPEIVGKGVTIRGPKPDVVTVRLDKRLRRDVPVHFVYQNATLAAEPKATVSVTAAESQWAKILQLMPNPELNTTAKDLKDLPVGKPVSVEFALTGSIASVTVQPDKDVVRVEVEVVERTQTRKLTASVRLLCPLVWANDGTWQRYTLAAPDEFLGWRPEITVTGSKKDLEALEARVGEIDAYVQLTEADKEPVGSWLVRTVTIRFPKDLNVQLVGEAPTVEFKMVSSIPSPTVEPTAPPGP
jgi:hypothetical protein